MYPHLLFKDQFALDNQQQLLSSTILYSQRKLTAVKVKGKGKGEEEPYSKTA